MDAIPLPSNFAEVERLIQALYQPAPPQTIAQIQEVLQTLQKSAGGWQLAQSLLSSKDENIKFFGALTLIVKLNTESSALSQDDAKQLLQSLIGWLIQFLEDGSSALVVRKLCAALATFFIHFPHLWSRCILHLLYCLHGSRAIPVEDVDEKPRTEVIEQHTSYELASEMPLTRVQAVIWFAANLVEDVGKTDMNSTKYADVHRRLWHDGQDVIPLLAFALSPALSRLPSEKGKTVQQESVACAQSWIAYAQRTPASANIDKSLRSLSIPLINCVYDSDLYDAAIELLIDSLNNNSEFFEEAQLEAISAMLDGEWAQKRYQMLMQGDFERDSVQFGSLMLAYGDALLTRLMVAIDDRSQRFWAALAGLTSAPGFPAGEDKIFTPTVELWATFVETFNDKLVEGDQDNDLWVPMATGHVTQVVSNCWQKLQWPPADVFDSWENDERSAFKEARKDVADLLQAVYALPVDIPLLSTFANSFLQRLPSCSWAELEATAFCLNALSISVAQDEQHDDKLIMVFSPLFFNAMKEQAGAMQPRARQTFMALIERYSDYFVRHPEVLPPALNILFDSLSDPALGKGSAQTIASLCSSCRSILTGEVPAFIAQYSTIYSSHPIDSVAEERVINGIALIIGAIADNEVRLGALSQLFAFARMDIERSVQLARGMLPVNMQDPLHRRGLNIGWAQKPPEQMTVADIAVELCVRGLRCVLFMARGVQSFDDGPVDLDAAPGWQGPRGNQLPVVQDDILSALNQALVTFPNDYEVIKAICEIFKAGFAEWEPGPFVFPPETVTNFFTSLSSTTPQIGTVLKTACSFLSSLRNAPEAQETASLTRLLPWVLTLLQAMPDPEGDIELSQNAIDFVQRLINRRPDIIFGRQPQTVIEFIFMHSLRVLEGSNPLPKAAAADLWSTFITLRSNDPLARLQKQTLSEENQAAVWDAISAAMEHFGPLVSRSLIFQVGGNAARSEVDKLCDPLKKLVVNQKHAQAWLEQALFDDNFPSTKVSAEEKRAFLRKSST